MDLSGLRRTIDDGGESRRSTLALRGLPRCRHALGDEGVGLLRRARASRGSPLGMTLRVRHRHCAKKRLRVRGLRPRPRNTGLPSRTHELPTLLHKPSLSPYAHLGGPKPPRPAPPPPPPPRPAPPPAASGWSFGRVLAVLAVIAALVWGITSCHALGPRTGAICRDGTYSSATGSGACSHHGGVDHWITK